MLGCLTMSLVFLALVVIGLAIGVKTQGGREMIARTVKVQTGLALMIGEAGVSLPCDLVLSEVAIKPEQAPEGGFVAKEIRLGWRPGGSLMEVRGAQLDLVQVADGWMPEPFSRIATLRDVRETFELFMDAPRRFRVDVKDSSIYWKGPDREPKAFVQGLNFWSGVSDTPEALMRVYRVNAQSVKREGRVQGRAIQRTWVSQDGVPYAEVSYKGEWEGDSRRVKDWWSSPEGH
jgi:hypothetical protein